MKLIAMALCAGTIFFAACNNSGDAKTGADSTKTADKKDEPKNNPPTTPPDPATAEKNWKFYGEAGKEHKMLAEWSGEWEGQAIMYMNPGHPDTSKTHTVNKMILGGRYQVSEHHGNMMGGPFEGRGTMGYDNALKVFEATWMDNMGTGTMKLTGTWDEATKSITLTGPMVDPGSLKTTTFKEVFKVIDANTQHLEMYGVGPDGKDMKAMEIHYTRKK